MSNVRIPEKHVINAIVESKDFDGKGLILDHNSKPISSKDIVEKEKPATVKYSYPVGKDYHYYKRKVDGTDEWRVSYVVGNKIPSGCISIETKTAFEMMFGIPLANTKGNKAQWKKINQHEHGEIIVETTDLNMKNFPNPNDDDVIAKYRELSSKIINV